MTNNTQPAADWPSHFKHLPHYSCRCLTCSATWARWGSWHPRAHTASPAATNTSCSPHTRRAAATSARSTGPGRSTRSGWGRSPDALATTSPARGTLGAVPLEAAADPPCRKSSCSRAPSERARSSVRTRLPCPRRFHMLRVYKAQMTFLFLTENELK